MRNAGRGCATVDVHALWTRVEQLGLASGKTTLGALSAEIGCSRSTLNRLSHGFAPDAHNLAAILFWIGERSWWILPKTPPDPPASASSIDS